jgi:hypothetical protein
MDLDAAAAAAAGEDAAQFAEDGRIVAALEALNVAGAAALIHKLELAQHYYYNAPLYSHIWGAPLLQPLSVLHSLAELEINQLLLDAGGVECIGKLTGISKLNLRGARFDTNIDTLCCCLARLPSCPS